MTPEEIKTIGDVVRRTETDIRRERDSLEDKLVFIELVLLPVAMIVTVFLPSITGTIVFMPNLILRAYQFYRNR